MTLRLDPSNRFITLTGGALTALACTLGIPSEEEVFGAAAPAGTGAESGTGSGSGGTSNTGGAGPAAGTGNSPSMTAGEGGTPSSGEGGQAGDGEPPAPSEGGEGGDGGEGGGIVLPPAVLHIHYTFDDLSTFEAIDSSGNELHGTLNGESLPEGEQGQIDGCIRLDGKKKQYVVLPPDLLAGREAVSIASWVKLSTAQPWDRLFDFNSSELNWFYYSPTGWNFNTGAPGTHIAVRNAGILAPEIQLTKTLSVGLWHHIAVVFAPPYLRYYLDGKLEAEISNMTLAPRDLGQTHQNWIGRSVYPTDPYLSALIDDFRFYLGALTSEEVAELAEP
jgi:hypothetical protein